MLRHWDFVGTQEGLEAVKGRAQVCTLRSLVVAGSLVVASVWSGTGLGVRNPLQRFQARSSSRLNDP